MLATYQLKILQFGVAVDGSGAVTDTGNNGVLKLSRTAVAPDGDYG
jgi:hypothetical protein